MMWRNILGIFLVVLGVVGFLTVADDLRHTGEMWGVGSVLVAGFVLLGSLRVKKLALQWLALGLLAGILVGAGLDNMPLGIGLGAALGALPALLLGQRGR
jgi:hypothetical protein